MSILDVQNGSIMNQGESSLNQKTLQKAQFSDDFKNALDLLPHMIWMSKAGLGYANPALRNYIGAENGHISEREWFKFLHPEDAEHFYTIWMQAQKSGQKFEKECRIRIHSKTSNKTQQNEYGFW